MSWVKTLTLTLLVIGFKLLNDLWQISQFEDVKFEAASILSEFYCQQVGASGKL